MRGILGDASEREDSAVSVTLPAAGRALIRREQLLCAHPNLRISAGTGYWQAEIDEPRGMTVTTRYELDELCDRVERLMAVT
jgi:hypothetical protein